MSCRRSDQSGDSCQDSTNQIFGGETRQNFGVGSPYIMQSTKRTPPHDLILFLLLTPSTASPTSLSRVSTCPPAQQVTRKVLTDLKKKDSDTARYGWMLNGLMLQSCCRRCGAKDLALKLAGSMENTTCHQTCRLQRLPLRVARLHVNKS